jgi:hypothetical protein
MKAAEPLGNKSYKMQWNIGMYFMW